MEPEDDDERAKKWAVLYAEDEEELKDLTVELLSSKGFNVLPAGDGEEALDVFSKNADGIGAVLTDVVMPKMNGKELFDKIRETDPRMGVVFISGYSRKELSKEESALPANTKFFSKPVNMDDIERTLVELIRVRRP